MQNKNSNQVFVVSLSNSIIENSTLSWIDIVEKKNHYFCPFGINGWPKLPPNYIAFRYYGKLQSIHYIEGYTITKNLYSIIPELPQNTSDYNYIVFDLGTPIIPNKIIKTGKGIYRNGRVWAALDLLLTCDTITEARDKTKERIKY